MLKVIAYIDGYNFYYGKLKSRNPGINAIRRKLRWLNIQKLIEGFLPVNSELVCINFYTAKISTRYSGDKSPIYQDEYFRALRSLDKVKIIEGRFSKNIIKMPCYPVTIPIKLVDVIKTEEKRSDVNIACHLVRDAYENNFDYAIIVTNDSDLLEPIKIINNLHKRFVILNPHQNTCHDFKINFDQKSMTRIKESHLKLAQFPPILKDNSGKIIAACPKKWN